MDPAPVRRAIPKKRPADLKFFSFSIALGCKVIAAASSDGKRQFCKDHGGVDEVVDYTKEGWQVSLVFPAPFLPCPSRC